MSNPDRFVKAVTLLPYAASVTSFARFIGDAQANQKELFELIQGCKIDEVKCRFNVWRLVLRILPFEGTLEERQGELSRWRASYLEKREQAFADGVGVKKEANIPKNPLMKAMMKAPKVVENSNEFLRDEIRKDVERTYQEMNFFQDESIIRLLSNVLFVWCKRNPEVSYKQGMNEVMASIVYVYFQEVYIPERKPEHWNDVDEQMQKTYANFNGIEHAEADIYAIFEKVMNIQHQMYRTEADQNLKGAINPNSKNNTPILQRILTITDQKLKTLDLELFRAIKLQDVQTKTFLLRWIRCMHTRQFSLENSFLIWDSIFLDYYQYPGSKEKCQFEFIDAMCLAMFIYMRTMALSRETAYEIQQIYQKYPQLKKGGYLEELISLAWSLGDALRANSTSTHTDWYGEESTKTNSKLQFVGSKDIPGSKSYHQEMDMKVQQQKQMMKKASQSAKQLDRKPSNTQNSAASESSPLKAPEPIKQEVPVAVPVPVAPKEQEIPNYPIVLQAGEWQALQRNLKSSLVHNTDNESRKYLVLALELLEQKIKG